MIIVFPIFPFDEAEGQWLRENSAPIAARIRRLNDGPSHGIVKIWVVSNQRALLDLLGGAGVGCLFYDDRLAEPKSVPGPSGMTDGLAALEKDSDIHQNDLVMVCDYRNTQLEATALGQAVESYNETDCSLMISMTAVEDHPCQYDIYYQIVDLDTIVLLETAQDPAEISDLYAVHAPIIEGLAQGFPDNIVVTHPYDFDWGAQGIFGGGRTGVYGRVSRHLISRMVPMEEVQAATDHFSVDVSGWYLFVDQQHARRLWDSGPLSCGDCRIAGMPGLRSSTQAACLLVSTPPHKGVNIFIGRAHAGKSLRLRFWSLDSDHEQQQRGIELDVIVPTQQADAGLEGTALEGFVDCGALDSTLLDEIQPAGAAVAILSRSTGGVADLEEPLDSCTPLWTIDPMTKRRLTVTSHVEISGRQSFPELYVYCPGLVMFRMKNFSRLSEMIESGDVRVFEMPEDTNGDSSRAMMQEGKKNTP